MKTLLNILSILVLVFLLGSCTRDHDRSAHTDSEVRYTCPMHPQIVQDGPGTCPICFMDLVPISHTGTESNEIMLSESQIALGNIQVQGTDTAGVSSQVVLNARLSVNEQQTQVISSRAAGRIERLYIKETGVPVQQGQALYDIYSEELLTLQNEYLLALEQQKQLGADNPRFASFAESARRKLELFGLSPAQITTLARSGRTSPQITFQAPAAGVVSEIFGAEGQYVAEGATLYRLESLDPVWVEAELFSNEASLVQTGQQVQVVVAGFENQPVNGRVNFISPEFRAGSQVTIMRVELPNPQQRFIPGMQASVRLPRSGQQQTSLSIPANAVIHDEKGSHVWVQTTNNTFAPRWVSLGLESVDRVEVTSGLQASDRVVISGAYLLYSEWILKRGGSITEHQH